MAARKRASAGERVLEGRHVIGLFFLMLLFSGVFFTLGYVMGRNQLESQVRAASTAQGNDAATPVTKPEPLVRPGKTAVSTPGPIDSNDVNAVPASPDWGDFYNGGEKASTSGRAKSMPSTTSFSSTPVKATPTNTKAPAVAHTNTTANGIPRGSYLLQVAALRVESEAIAIANDLRKKKFPAFVQAPQGDKYYRVQVGPYTDQKPMLTAKKGLESAGFKAIIKH
jgi:cell division septation protein DedD